MHLFIHVVYVLQKHYCMLQYMYFVSLFVFPIYKKYQPQLVFKVVLISAKNEAHVLIKIVLI